MHHTLRRIAKSIPGLEFLYRRLNPPAPGSLGLTSTAEREYYRRVAAQEYTGQGAVIDLGSWLGSTAAALAQGLLENERPEARSAKVHTFDLFIWHRGYDPYAPRGLRFAHGESFLPAFKRNVRPWLRQIEIHAGDLTQHNWEGPVEIILNDASKSWTVVETVWKQFVTGLRIGGLLIEQDFKHYHCPWLHLLHYRFRDRFELAQDVRGGQTVAFRLLKPISDAELAAALGWDAYQADERRLAFDWAASLVDEECRPAIFAAEAMFYVHQGDAAGGRQALRALESIDGDSNFDVFLTRAACEKLSDPCEE